MGTETEIEGDVSTYASGTLIDSFNLSASRTNEDIVTATYNGYNHYYFEYTVMGVDGAIFNLLHTLPSGRTWNIASSKTAVTNDVLDADGWFISGTHTLKLEVLDGGSGYGVVIHVRVYGL